ncbi:MAG: cobalt transporter CbiM [Deltaproteobacteria bacterium]|jgi:cobalt/nickel transport system permease protein|nr:cobalt transporter CbiM [Deltaproteobacteria bacterium]
MHISEGILSAPVLATGAALSLGGLFFGFGAIKDEDTPKVAILSAVFFVASLFHVNIGPSSTHLVLSGLMGLMLGWAAFPVIFFGLLLQGILFGFGGLTTLGVNTFTMASPAVLCGVLFRGAVTGPNPAKAAAAGFVCGFFPVAISACLVGLALWLSGEGDAYSKMAWLVIAGNFPVMIMEGFVCAFCVGFFRKVRPGLLVRAPAKAAEKGAA